MSKSRITALELVAKAQATKFRSDYLVDEPGQTKTRERNVADRRDLLKMVVPSSAWFEDLMTCRGQKFPVPGMCLSNTKTLYPNADSPSYASRRFVSPHCVEDEDVLDAMDWREAERYQSPSAWSAADQVLGVRRRRVHQIDPLSPDEAILRSVKLGDYPQRRKVAFDGGHAERTYVRVRVNFENIGEEHLEWPALIVIVIEAGNPSEE